MMSQTASIRRMSEEGAVFKNTYGLLSSIRSSLMYYTKPEAYAKSVWIQNMIDVHMLEQGYPRPCRHTGKSVCLHSVLILNFTFCACLNFM